MVLLLAVLLPAASADAFVLRRIEATCAGGVYRVALDAEIDAPAAQVEAVLTDFPGYRTLDPRIESVETLAGTVGDATLLRTRIEACAGIFCRSVLRVERVQHLPGELLATVVPERSDLRRGETRTRWSPETGERTLVSYVTEFQPAFWIPPFVGRRLALRTLRESTLQLFRNVERRARERRSGP